MAITKVNVSADINIDFELETIDPVTISFGELGGATVQPLLRDGDDFFPVTNEANSPFSGWSGGKAIGKITPERLGKLRVAVSGVTTGFDLTITQ